MSEINGNVMTPPAEQAPVDGNKRRHGSYSYQRTYGGGYAIYKAENQYSANKVADVTLRGDEGKAMAFNMVAALNARERWLEKNDFNKQ